MSKNFADDVDKIDVKAMGKLAPSGDIKVDEKLINILLKGNKKQNGVKLNTPEDNMNFLGEEK